MPLTSSSEFTPSEFTQSRRSFLRGTVAAGALAVGGQFAAPIAKAAEPPQRNGKPHIKLSVAAYSYRQFLSGASPTMTLDDFITACADLGLDGCEPTSYYFPKDFGNDYLIHIKELAFRLGLDFSGTAIANDFCLPPGPDRDKTLAHTRKWIDYAALFGAPVIRIFAGGVPKGDNEEVALARCTAGINESLDYAAEKGVFLALENHGGITSTAEQLLAIVKSVKPSPWFGVNFDSGNFKTPDPYGDLAKIAPYAINAQLKTDISPDGKREDADLERLVKILMDAGYRGYAVLEYEGAEDPKTAIPKHIERLKNILHR